MLALMYPQIEGRAEPLESGREEQPRVGQIEGPTKHWALARPLGLQCRGERTAGQPLRLRSACSRPFRGASSSPFVHGDRRMTGSGEEGESRQDVEGVTALEAAKKRSHWLNE